MPLYEFACNVCSSGWESVRKIEERGDEWCQECGNLAMVLITNVAEPITYEYFSENLNTHITGPAQRRRVMREKNMEEM